MNIENTPTESGDDCHRDILNVTNKVSGNFAKKHFKSPSIYMCCPDGVKQLTQEQYEDLLSNLCATAEVIAA